MDNAITRAALAVREWRDRLDRAETELESGASMPRDGVAARRMRHAIERARSVLAGLARGEEVIRAELSGTRVDGTGQALERWAHGESPGTARRGRPRRAEWRDVAPTQALIDARLARDAVLRLGVWSVLGDALAAARLKGRTVQVTGLIDSHSGNAEAVPPGIAPTLAYAGSSDAQGFFNTHLRGVLDRIALRRGPDGVAAPRLPAMDRTAALAQRWSQAWSNAACVVYADWLQRRGDGTLEGARLSLWQFNDRETPVRFRPADGLTVIPTKGFRLHVDLWLQPVLAQVLAFDAARWDSEPVDGRWHPVRLAIHDLAARDVGDSAEGSRTLFRGLSVEMLYQAVFIDRVASLLGQETAASERPATTPLPESAPLPEAVPAASTAPPTAHPAMRAGQQPTREAVQRRFDGEAESDSRLRQRDAGPPSIDFTPEQRRAFEGWQDHAVQDGAVVPLAPSRLDWHAATAADAAGADPTLLPVGSVELWQVLGEAAGWIDFAAIGRTAEGWVDLPIELVDAPAAHPRTWLALGGAARHGTVVPGVDLALLRRRLGEARHCCWMCRRDGLGAFVTLGVDLRPPR